MTRGNYMSEYKTSPQTSPHKYWKKLLAEIAEVARLTLKNMVACNTPPLPRCYEREFWDVACRLGKADVLDLAKSDNELVLKKLEKVISSSEAALSDAKSVLSQFGTEAKGYLEQLEQNLISLHNKLDPDAAIPDMEENVQAIQNVGGQLLQGLTTALERIEKQEEAFQSLKKQLDQDPLTRVYNRRSWDRDIKDIVLSGKEDPQDPGVFSVVMVDIDHFKSINDTYGHPIGDAVLRQFAGLLKDHFSHCGSVYRYGGEEFGIILPGIDQEEAKVLVEMFRDRLNRAYFTAQQGALRLSITASYGISTWSPDLSCDELVSATDRALYKAKKDGRDCIRMAEIADATA